MRKMGEAQAGSVALVDHGVGAAGGTPLTAEAAGVARMLVAAARAWWPLWLMVGLYFLASRAVLWPVDHVSIGSRILVNSLRLVAILAVAGLLIFPLWRLAVYVLRERPASPMRQLWRDFRLHVLSPARALNFLALYPVVMGFFTVFIEVKGNITRIQPFAWDEAFMWLDRWLHGGVDPWRLLAPLFDSPAATMVLGVAYNLWFLLLLLPLYGIALSRGPSRRKVHFLLAFLLTWSIGGSLFAIIFSSAGPVYYGNLGLAPDPFAPLMEKLRAFNEVLPIWSVDTQDLLWRKYIDRDIELAGISAFPSMHNAHAALIALAAWRINRWVGVVATAYAGLILLGSVWLGWHYAVDGYAGVAIAICCWLVAGRLAKWFVERPAMARYMRLLRRWDDQARAGG